MKRLLDHDPETGVTEIFHYDKLTGNAYIETIQDVEPHLEYSKALAKDEQYTKDGIKKEMWHYCHIPIALQMEWLIKYGRENDPMRKGNEKLLFSLVNDRNFKGVKCTNKIHVPR